MEPQQHPNGRGPSAPTSVSSADPPPLNSGHAPRTGTGSTPLFHLSPNRLGGAHLSPGKDNRSLRHDGRAGVTVAGGPLNPVRSNRQDRWGRACRRHFRPSRCGGHVTSILRAWHWPTFWASPVPPARVAVKVVIRKQAGPTSGGPAVGFRRRPECPGLITVASDGPRLLTRTARKRRVVRRQRRAAVATSLLRTRLRRPGRRGTHRHLNRSGISAPPIETRSTRSPAFSLSASSLRAPITARNEGCALEEGCDGGRVHLAFVALCEVGSRSRT